MSKWDTRYKFYAYGREALLRAKEAAEDLGFTVLHLYVDGMWVQKEGLNQSSDFETLLKEIHERTRLPLALDGIYRWICFLPSRRNKKVPVANRYFGVFQRETLQCNVSTAVTYTNPAYFPYPIPSAPDYR